MRKLTTNNNSPRTTWQIRFHGRGGQGVVTGAEIIAIAAFKDGLYAQAFPFFGVERTGAPIQAFARVSQEPIIVREQVYNPDIIVIQDATLLSNPVVTAGAKTDTLFLVNTAKERGEVVSTLSANKQFKLNPEQVVTIDATDIALKIIGRNIVNTVILGALAKKTSLVSLRALTETVTEKFSGKGEKIITSNVAAVTAAYEQ